jgi:tetratricopeptide (TPR) repeat protein
MTLGPLSQEQVAQLIRTRIGAAPGPQLREQAALAGGNPLYVLELVDALERDGYIHVRSGLAELTGEDVSGPATLAAAISDRLAFLSPPTLQMLRMAALLGAQFNVEDMAVVFGFSARELVRSVDEARAAGVLTASEHGLTFRHELIRRALHESMAPPLRAALHRQVGQALAEAGASMEEVAEHLLAASDRADGWVAQWTARTAPALVFRAPQVAARLLDRVLPHVGFDDPAREQIEVQLITAMDLLGRYDELERRASAMIVQTTTPDVIGRLAWILGKSLQSQARLSDALAVADDALRKPELTLGWTARVRALRAMILASRGEYARARVDAARAQTDGEQARDPLAVGYALHMMAQLEQRERRDEAAFLETVDRALAVIGERPETSDLRLVLMGNRAVALDNVGRLDEADRAFGQVLTLAEQGGDMRRLAQLVSWPHSTSSTPGVGMTPWPNSTRPSIRLTQRWSAI